MKIKFRINGNTKNQRNVTDDSTNTELKTELKQKLN